MGCVFNCSITFPPTFFLFFQLKPTRAKIVGVLIACIGCTGLYIFQQGVRTESNTWLIGLVILATLCYGINVNLVQRHLKGFTSLEITALAMFLNAIPAAIVLVVSGYFSLNLADKGVMISTGFSALLGIAGTSLANILFYILIKKAGPIFSSMVTYGIPFVAIGWGLIYGEQIGWMQVVSLLVILAGVFVANAKVLEKN